MSARLPHPPRLLQRAFAALGVALVLALGVFGANVQWHDALHGADPAQPAANHAERGDGCAVDLFAGGVSVPLEIPAAVARPMAPAAERIGAAREAWVGQPEHRLLPGRGPPRV